MNDPRRIHKAHPRERRKALIGLVIAVGLMALLLAYGGGAWQEEETAVWITAFGDVLVRSPAIAGGCTFVVFLPVVVFALFTYGYGVRIKRTGRFPPPDARVVRDTAIVEGEKAVRHGAILQALGLLLFVAVCGVVYLVWRLFQSLGVGP